MEQQNSSSRSFQASLLWSEGLWTYRQCSVAIFSPHLIAESRTVSGDGKNYLSLAPSLATRITVVTLLCIILPLCFARTFT